MSIWKKASKEKLRFTTTYGVVSSEQLWDLKMDVLKTVVINAHEELVNSNNKVSEDLDFLSDSSLENPEKDRAQLAYDIVKDVWQTRAEDNRKAYELEDKKRYNQHLDELIAEKKESDLKSLSIEELEKLRK